MPALIRELDATPPKRIFLSIIADYGIRTGLCELVDNAIDSWAKAGKRGSLDVQVTLDVSQQTILVEDNAGGVREANMEWIVGPGHTGNDADGESIGFFGVGTKRAVVALAESTKIHSRAVGEAGCSVTVDDDWLHEDDWQLGLFRSEAVREGHTRVELSKLRRPLAPDTGHFVRERFGATYSGVLQEHPLRILVDGEPVVPQREVPWAYPPGFEPQRLAESVKIDDGVVEVTMIAGLASESRDDYGLTVVCNGRQVVAGKRDYYSGFVAGIAGKPHPDIALTRVVAELRGPARLMPWTSDKSDVNAGHPTFQAIQVAVHKLASQYAKVSRAFAGQFAAKVSPFTTGKVRTVPGKQVITSGATRVLKPPRTKYHAEEKLERRNRKVAREKPWTVGLYEAVAAVDLIRGKKAIKQRNRFALILLDSTIEIACKEYLVYEKKKAKTSKSLAKLCPTRADLQEVTRAASKTPKKMWALIDYYYQKRNALVHETAGYDPSDVDIDRLEKTVKELLMRLFKVEFI